jgi:outer membrane protein OmpA-like peptidoglycan-associated protein
VPVAGTLARIELILPAGHKPVRRVTWTFEQTQHGRLFGNGVTYDKTEQHYTSASLAVDWDTQGAGSNQYTLTARPEFEDGSALPPADHPGNLATGEIEAMVDVIESRPAGPVVVATTAGEKAAIPFDVQAVWVAIRNRTQAIGFGAYSQFIDNLVCCLAGRDCVMPANRTLASAMAQRPQIVGLADQLGLNPARILSQGVYGYDLLRLATQAFLAMNVGLLREGPNGEPRIPTPPDFDAGEEQSRLGYPTDPDTVAERLRAYLKDDGRVLPYLDSVVTAMLGTGWRESGALGCYQDVLQHRLESPAMLELIWSYWHEEGALTQTMNAIALRFQNKRRRGNDPLAQLEIDPLRPLNSLIWGHIQSEYKRLSVVRRAYEYDHHYGITLRGPRDPCADDGGQPLQVPGGVPQPADAHGRLLSRGRRHDGGGRRLPRAERAARPAPRPRGGGAQPVRRPALDRARGDADRAVAAGEARDARVPARPGHGALRRALDGPGRRDEAPAGLARHRRLLVPRTGGVRRAAPALGPIHRLDAGEQRGPGARLGAVLEARGSGLRACVPRRDERPGGPRGRAREPAGCGAPAHAAGASDGGNGAAPCGRATDGARPGQQEADMWNRELLADLEAETFEPESLDEAGAADFEAGREEEAGTAWAGEEEAFPLGELDELDELDEILEAEATPRITRFGGRYRVVLTGFAFDRSNLPADAVARLKGLVDTVRASQRGPAPVRLIEVIGHTDPVGTDAYNLQLGCRRAAVVAARLRRMMDPQLSGRVRVRVASMGERQAVPGRDSFNRRVEIALLTTPRPRPPGSTRCPHVPGAGTPARSGPAAVGSPRGSHPRSPGNPRRRPGSRHGNARRRR